MAQVEGDAVAFGFGDSGIKFFNLVEVFVTAGSGKVAKDSNYPNRFAKS